MSAKLTWRALDEAGEARTAANRPAFSPQTPDSSEQTSFWPRNLPQEAIQFLGPVPKKEIPAESRMGELRFLRESAIRTTVECGATAEDRSLKHASTEPRQFCAYNQTRGSLLGVEVEVADFSPASLESRLPALTSQSGIALWIVPFRGISPANIHTPLDLLYLDSKNAVLDVVEFFPIGRVSASSRPAASVLALPADTIAAIGIYPGDQLILCPPEEMKRRLRDLSNAEAGDRGTRTSPSGADPPAGNQPGYELHSGDPSRAGSPSVTGDQAVSSPGPSAVAHPLQTGRNEPEPTKNWLQRLFKRGPRELRKARREPVSGMVAYFFTGGAPAAHLIRDISSTGIYIFTEERWYLGTVIRLTITDRQGSAAQHSITVNAKVVRWGNDGVGLEFVLTEDNNRRRSRSVIDDPLASVSRAMVKQFLELVKSTKL